MPASMYIIWLKATGRAGAAWSTPTSVVLGGTITGRQIEDYRLVWGPMSEVKRGEQVDQSVRSGSRGPDKRVRPCLR